MTYRRAVLGSLGLLWVAYLGYSGYALNAGKWHGPEFWVGCIILLFATVGMLKSLGSSDQGPYSQGPTAA